MAVPMRKPTGGFNKPVQWGPWINDTLSDGRQSHGYELYRQYKQHCLSFPLRRDGKRRTCSESTFRHYLYVLRELGLVEYVRDAAGDIQTSTAHGKDGNPTPDLAARNYLHAVMGRLGDAAWGDPWTAYRGY